MAPELSPEYRVIMEQACVTLREAERTAIVNVETGLVERFTQNASSVNLQAKNIRALKSVSSETRWKQNGTELRGIGRNMESLAIAYNKLDWGTLYEPGIAKQNGQPRHLQRVPRRTLRTQQTNLRTKPKMIQKGSVPFCTILRNYRKSIIEFV